MTMFFYAILKNICMNNNIIAKQILDALGGQQNIESLTVQLDYA